MANAEHLEILKQGVDAWNEWRNSNPTVQPDLTRAYLDNANLIGASLTWTDLVRASLRGAYLRGVDLRWAKLRGVDLRWADLSEADLSEANLSEADLSGADLSWADLREADLSRAKLVEADLSGASLRGASLRGAKLFGAKLFGVNLHKANLHKAYLRKVDLFRADFSEANLSEANFYEVNLSEVDLSGADLSKANFYEANLSEADLSGASLHEAKLHKADFSEVDLSGADLSGASLHKAKLHKADFSNAVVSSTVFADVDFSNAQGLETIFHHGPSTIGIDTIYRSGGKIPKEFLRGAGLPDNFIAYVDSLTAEAIKYYSAFISYSSKDEELAKRIYADLQSNNVRCWYAPEDMKTGEKIRRGIDEAIRIHDKLLLILSEHSVSSDWVEHEVETALAKEREYKAQNQERTILFPIRIDDTVMEIKTGWAAHVKNTRHIGDFRHWKGHDAYQHAFKRLLQDLKAEDSSG